ncbi:MAG: hypothetical protein WD200_01750 [Candidatus Andersenbacteria bacterium]
MSEKQLFRALRSIMFVSTVGVLTLIVFPAAAKLDEVPPGACSTWNIVCGSDLGGAIYGIINTFLVLVAVVAAVFVVIGGFQFITSSGDETQATKGKKTLLYATIGLIVVGLSAAIVNFVLSSFG